MPRGAEGTAKIPKSPRREGRRRRALTDPGTPPPEAPRPPRVSRDARTHARRLPKAHGPLATPSVGPMEVLASIAGGLTPEEADLVRQGAQDQLCIDYLEEFLQRAWHVVERGVHFDHNWHVDAVAHELQMVYPGVRSEEPPLGWDLQVARPPKGWSRDEAWSPHVLETVTTRDEAEAILEYLGSEDAEVQDPSPHQIDVVPSGGLTCVEEAWRAYCPVNARPAPLWRNTRLIINIPPGLMKSLLVSVFWPAHILIHDPGHKTLSIAGSDNISTRDAVRTRRIVGTKWHARLVRRHYASLVRTAAEATDGIQREDHRRAVQKGIMGAYYGVKNPEEPWTIDRKKDAKASFGTTLGGYRESKAIGGRITGERGYGWTLDDPIDAKEVLEHGQVDHVRVAERCAEVVQVIDKVLDTRVNDRRDGLHYNVIIMQRLHVDDPPGIFWLRTKTGKGKPWRFVVARARHVPCEDLGPEDPPNYERDPRLGGPAGASLFPKRLPPDVLDDLEFRLGDQFNAQYQQNPLPGKGGLMDEALSRAPRYWADPYRVAGGTAGLVTPTGKPLGQMEIMITVDATFGSKGATASNVAVEVWGRPYASEVRAWMFWLGCVAQRMNYTETEEAIRAVKKLWPMARRVLIEEKANGATLINRLSNSISGVEAYDPKGSKIVRAGVLASCMKAGQVWLPAGDPRNNDPGNPHTPWVYEAVTELVRFPGGRRDDRVDAASMAAIYWTENTPAVDPGQRAKARAAAMDHVAGIIRVNGAVHRIR